MKPTVLIVEDEPAIADTIQYALETEGFDTICVNAGMPVIPLMAEKTVDLIVLDIGLPDIGGFELCKEIRKNYRTPVIFLTARSDEVDRVVGLEIGGDDYVVKPFSPRELSARVKAVLRRTGELSPDPLNTRRSDPVKSHTPDRLKSRPAGQTKSHPPGQIKSHPPDQIKSHPPDLANTGHAAPDKAFNVDASRRQISYFGRILDLSRYEYEILKTFIDRPGHVFSRERLMDIVWDEPEASMDRTVDAHIKNLRAKLKTVKPDVDPIITHRGTGYALNEDL